MCSLNEEKGKQLAKIAQQSLQQKDDKLAQLKSKVQAQVLLSANERNSKV
jgi:hypothetical protein